MEKLVELQKKMAAIQEIAQWVFHDDTEVTLASFENGQMRLALDHKGDFDLEEWFQPQGIFDALQRLAEATYGRLAEFVNEENKGTLLDEEGVGANRERAEEVTTALNRLKDAGFSIVEQVVFVGEIEECADCGEQIEDCECDE